MDLAQTIQQLYAQQHRLEHVIAALEELQVAHASLGVPSGKRRGRKFMGAKEREEVSQRMAKYWANRRKHGKAKEKI